MDRLLTSRSTVSEALVPSSSSFLLFFFVFVGAVCLILNSEIWLVNERLLNILISMSTSGVGSTNSYGGHIKLILTLPSFEFLHTDGTHGRKKKRKKRGCGNFNEFDLGFSHLLHF